MFRTILAVTLIIAAIPIFAARRRSVAVRNFPACSTVSGTAAVVFSRDGGQTLVPAAQKLSGIGYTYGLAALDPSTLIAVHNTTVIVSSDAGCNWHTAGEVVFDDPYPPNVVPAGAARAYLWSDARRNLAVYANGAITTLKPPVEIAGLGAAGDRVRIGGSDGTLWESVDAGQSWSRIGSSTGGNAYRAAFDPSNLDHVVVGFMSAGASVTFDGGRTWTRANGFASPANVFSIVISPADPDVVWAMGLSIDGEKRHIDLSRDGGLSFTPVVEAGNGVTLVNGTLLAAHPANRDLLYFVFGTYFDGYGTDLFRFDAATHTLTKTHFSHDDFDAIAFSPADPNVMYFGLEVVQRTSP